MRSTISNDPVPEPAVATSGRGSAKYGNVFFHVGLHKTATSYLQDVVFPQWRGVKYLRFRNLEYFLALPEDGKYLVSCENMSGATFAPLDERCRGLTRLAEMFPGAHVIIAFRPHGDFIASLYSQYLRYGGQARFDGFFSTGRDDAVWRCEDLSYRRLVETIEKAFDAKPFVFQLGELKSNPGALYTDLARFMGTPPPTALDSGSPRNVSLGSWQGRLLRRINELVDTPYSRDGGNRPYRRLHRFGIDPPTICHRILGRLPKQPLVSREARQQITDAYRDDWDFVTAYIQSLPFRQVAS